MNKMKEIRIEKITLNIGVGEAGDKLEKASLLLKTLANAKPTLTSSSKRIPTWGVRPGLTIGTKVTLRGKAAEDLLKRLLVAKDNRLNPKNFDIQGNLSFGLPEYLEIPEIEYIPEVGIIGLEVSITLERPGFRVKKRKYQRKKLPKCHKITKEDAMAFIKQKYDTNITEESQDDYESLL
jgi:large subunit ribosomal protein L5